MIPPRLGTTDVELIKIRICNCIEECRITMCQTNDKPYLVHDFKNMCTWRRQNYHQC